MLGLALAAASGAQAQAQAQSPSLPPDADVTRYAYHRTDDGFARLDLRSGQVSHCARRPGGWACVAAADERAAYDAEIARLQADNAALKQALLERGAPLPQGIKPEAPPAPAPGPGFRPPNDADIERAMSMLERLWRRLVEMMANLQRDFNKT